MASVEQHGQKWRVRWRDIGGKRRSESCTRKADAIVRQAELVRLRETRHMEDPDRGRIRLQDFAEGWFRDHVLTELAPSTARGYIENWSLIEDRLGAYSLRELEVRPEVIGEWRGEITADRPPSVVRAAMATLQACLAHAVDQHLMRTNPLRGMRRPSIQREERPALTARDVERLRACALQLGDIETATLISVLAYAHLRPSEALGLAWEDIDLDNSSLSVRRVLDGRHGMKERGKTKRSLRTVPLIDPLVDDLRAYKAAEDDPSSGLLHYVRVNRGNRPVGSPWSRSGYQNWKRRRFDQTLRGLVWMVAAEGGDWQSLQGLRPYDLRHAGISLRLREGWPPVDVAAISGNSLAVISSTYAHSMPDRQGEVVSMQEAVIGARDQS